MSMEEHFKIIIILIILKYEFLIFGVGGFKICVYGPLCHPAFNAGNRPTSLILLIALICVVSVCLCVRGQKMCGNGTGKSDWLTAHL